MTQPETEKFWTNAFRVTAIFLLIGVLYYCQANIRDRGPSRSPIWTVTAAIPIGEHHAFWNALEAFAEDEALAIRHHPEPTMRRNRITRMNRSDVEILEGPYVEDGYSLSAYPYPKEEHPPEYFEGLMQSLERQLNTAGFKTHSEMR